MEIQYIRLIKVQLFRLEVCSGGGWTGMGGLRVLQQLVSFWAPESPL